MAWPLGLASITPTPHPYESSRCMYLIAATGDEHELSDPGPDPMHELASDARA